MKSSTIGHIAGWLIAAIIASLFLFIAVGIRTQDLCKAWGWQDGHISRTAGVVCVGKLDSDKQVKLSLEYIEQHACVGPYDITAKVKTCPSGIFYRGTHPFFERLKINGDQVSY